MIDCLSCKNAKICDDESDCFDCACNTCILNNCKRYTINYELDNSDKRIKELLILYLGGIK